MEHLAVLVAAGLGFATVGPASSAAERVLQTLPKKGPGVASAASAEQQARKALWRARQAHTAGGGVEAKLLDALALEWAELARDIHRTTEQEADSALVQAKSAKTAAKVREYKALLEQLAAQRAAAQGELTKLRETTSKPIPPASIKAARATAVRRAVTETSKPRKADGKEGPQ